MTLGGKEREEFGLGDRLYRHRFGGRVASLDGSELYLSSKPRERERFY